MEPGKGGTLLSHLDIQVKDVQFKASLGYKTSSCLKAASAQGDVAQWWSPACTRPQHALGKEKLSKFMEKNHSANNLPKIKGSKAESFLFLTEKRKYALME